MIPIEYQVGVRDRWPDNTIMLAGGLTPNQGVDETIERLNKYVDQYRISGLKLYTFDSTDQKAGGSMTKRKHIQSGRNVVD